LKVVPAPPMPSPSAATKAHNQQNQSGDPDQKIKFTGLTERMTMAIKSSRVVEFPFETPKMLVNDPDLVRVVPLSPRSIQISALKPGRTQLNVWNADDKITSIDIVIDDDVTQLRDE